MLWRGTAWQGRNCCGRARQGLFELVAFRESLRRAVVWQGLASDGTVGQGLFELVVVSANC